MTPISADPIRTPSSFTRPLMSVSERSARSRDPPAALRRDASRVTDPIVLSTRGLSVWYGASLAIKEITIDIPRNKITALDRPVGLRQEHLAPLLQPDERPDRRRAHARARSASTAI